jgi:hypothetical protein
LSCQQAASTVTERYRNTNTSIVGRTQRAGFAVHVDSIMGSWLAGSVGAVTSA